MNETLYGQMVAAAELAVRTARGVRREQLDDATPCAKFDVRALVDHWVLYTSHGLEHRARREPLPPALTERDFTADPEWAQAYAEQLERAVAAWAEPEAWRGEVDLGGGTTMPAEAIFSMILKEMVVHGWDVARATGQDFPCPPSTATTVLAVVEEYAPVYRQYDGFADPVAVPEGASAFDRALGLSGRDPGWAPPRAEGMTYLA
ncbi:TIGR03086 family protein [Streptomyces sp. PTM05]|uniref:TIGR03086 family protein n=1 Tax=Streptantibioticus parmotrematis TaxID=2873249 RepID=A0ABS7QNU7_9ACTN|nr:TIGR03086 family metal-binding protein [Streptantibioticus parmotrematis]MBY8884856.1 TIGR03086 family protein [Streptantibioticus parmotrematis]